MTAGGPNAFIQMDMPKSKEFESQIIMKITGVTVYLLM